MIGRQALNRPGRPCWECLHLHYQADNYHENNNNE